MIKIGLWGTMPYIDLPYHWLGWLGWVLLALPLFLILRRSVIRGQNTHAPSIPIFLVLLIATIITNLFGGFQIPGGQMLPLPNVPREVSAPLVMVFSALPWILASGFLNPVMAAVLALVGGIISALWGTHSLFTPLETTAVSLMISAALRQDYRTLFYKLLRHPLGATLFVAVASTPIYLYTTFFATNGALSARLDYAFTQSWNMVIVNGMELIIAGALLELFLVNRTKLWIQFKTLNPSPSESGLQSRMLYNTLPLMLVLLIALAVADWYVAGNAARQMVRNQLDTSANTAAENLPYFLETGQSLSLDLAGSNLLAGDASQLGILLQNKLRSVPYFRDLYVFDKGGNPVTGYPTSQVDALRLSDEERSGIQLALNGVVAQYYMVPPKIGEDSVQVTFIAAIPDEYGMANGVLLARTDLATNFFSQPALAALDEVKAEGGTGVILDERNRVLYSTESGKALTTYNGYIPEVSGYYDETSATGTRRLLYAVITSEDHWKVLLSLPATVAQEMALSIAVPLLAMALVVSVIVYLLLRLLMNKIARSLVSLADRADEIARGSLDKEIETSGVDEIGRLGSAFEQMRMSLKERLEELDHLLKVSQGVASNLTMEGSAQHILNATLVNGATSSRLILRKPGTDEGAWLPGEVFAAGPSPNEYDSLDEVMIDLLQDEKITIIPSKARIKRLGMTRTDKIPSAVAGIAIRDEVSYFGILWIAYAQTHRFQDSEIRYLTTIAGEAHLAIANSALYQQAEIGRKRLENVLASTPEPVLLFGEDFEIILSNPAAETLAGLVTSSGDGSPGKMQIGSEILEKYLKGAPSSFEKPAELALENGRVYQVSVSTADIDQKRVGTVCVLQDITEYKELDRMKSEFVQTVSHDLRSPLSQVKGYSTMLQMVGELNDQQKAYTNKIEKGLETMNQMVDNLLDMGRIEGGIELQIETVKPYDLLDQVMAMLQPQATQKKIQLMRELTTAQDIEIEADQALLQQALFNLLDNAVKYSPLNSQVNLRLVDKGDSVVFAVQDHGVGIAPLDLPYVFERFHKTGRKDGHNQKSVGLGLTIVKSIAERHKGRSWVESVLGKGSTFFIEIPKHQPGKK